ncbi:MAG: site-specific DNA-methyltransferase [Dermatophilaceae bacterium]
MAHIDALVDKVADPALRQMLRDQVELMLSKQSFGLVFQPHKPETVELPHYRVRRGCKVRLKSEASSDFYVVESIAAKKTATIVATDETAERWDVDVSDLVVVREFGEPIYPGLRSTGRITRGGDKPTHIVINAENFHALETLLYTHERKVDAIYIDPPYNTRDKDWKYNNDYVDPVDRYRHSKWLAMMKRRLELAKQLLNPDRSVLIVTIDDNEVNRLGLLVEEVFAGFSVQMVTSVINPRGQYRPGGFSRCDEYLFFLTLGSAQVIGEPDEDYSKGANIAWRTFRRSDVTSARGTSKGGKSQFYPIYVNDKTRRIELIGAPLDHDVSRASVPRRKACTAVFPVRDDGTEMNWGLTPASVAPLLAKGYVRVGRHTPSQGQKYEISYLTAGRIDDIESGRATVLGYDEAGAVIAQYVSSKLKMPLSNWTKPSHNAETGGTNMLKSLLGVKNFPYPKSLYAVEDALRFFVADQIDAVVLDFFGGSGTTTHAVARLNRQDGGHRQSILVTNNEVSESEAKALRRKGLHPGDEEWERLGICNSVTIPRLAAAFTGRMSDGTHVPGDYKYIDERPMAAGFDENLEFFELTYEDPDLVSLGRRFPQSRRSCG